MGHIEQERSRSERNEREFREIDRRRRELFPILLKLVPRLNGLHRQVIAGVVSPDDHWLTYFSYQLQWTVAINRQDDGPELLFTEEAFDAALFGLYHAVPISQ